MTMKKDKPKTGKNMLELFDKNADMFYMFGSRTKDFTPIINTLELFVKQIGSHKNYPQDNSNNPRLSFGRPTS